MWLRPAGGASARAFGRAMTEITTYLEMRSPDELRPAGPARVSFETTETTDHELVRALIVRIGTPHRWSQVGWTDQRWTEHLARPSLRHLMATADGQPSGLCSVNLPEPGSDAEIDAFGLVPERVGCGIGGAFLTAGIRWAWSLAPSVRRLWLHTSTWDHAHAAPNYLARGLAVYRVEEGPRSE